MGADGAPGPSGAGTRTAGNGGGPGLTHGQQGAGAPLAIRGHQCAVSPRFCLRRLSFPPACHISYSLHYTRYVSLPYYTVHCVTLHYTTLCTVLPYPPHHIALPCGTLHSITVCYIMVVTSLPMVVTSSGPMGQRMRCQVFEFCRDGQHVKVNAIDKV